MDYEDIEDHEDNEDILEEGDIIKNDCMTPSETKRLKMRIKNKIRDGIISSPLLTDNVKFEGGSLHFKCPSTYIGRYNIQYDVTIRKNNNKLKIECNCRNGKNNKICCKHKTATLLHIINEFINIESGQDTVNDMISMMYKMGTMNMNNNIRH